MHAFLNTATKVIRNASKILLRGFDSLESHPDKLDEQVQKLREKLEAKVYTELAETYPHHEFAFPGLVIKNYADIIWHINVLSGENNFRHGIPHFAMVITIHEKHKPQHALIFNPTLQEQFTVTKNEQAQLNNKRLRVSTHKELENALVASNFGFNHQPLYRSGCPALELAYVAAGRLDGFVGKDIDNNDLTAGTLMVKTAGGLFSDWQGDMKYQETGELIAANAKLFKELLKLKP